jgi:hypothetical protein
MSLDKYLLAAIHSSLKSGHIDWYRDYQTGINVYVIENDNSRKILVAGQVSEINAVTFLYKAEKCKWKLSSM